jgi:uncharacterized membrane protein
MFFKKAIFSKQQEAIIIEAIKVAEKNTSGEIRVHVESNCDKNEFERALEVFSKLNMHQTKEHNGVLIYVAMDSRKLAIVADKGINEKVPVNFWHEIRDGMIQQFQKQNHAEGIAEGIIKCGQQLKKFFPYRSNDTNELPDSISYKA